MVQGQQSPIKMPGLCKGQSSLGVFLFLLAVFFLVICLLKIDLPFSPLGLLLSNALADKHNKAEVKREAAQILKEFQSSKVL